MVAVTVCGSNSYAFPAGFFFPFPSARPLQVPVTNTGGDWMLGIVTWRQPLAGQGVTVSFADDQHNWWEPLGAPSGDSPAAGVTRTAIWAAPAAQAAKYVQAAASGPVLSLAVTILDVSGMLPWMTLTPFQVNYALAATTVALSAAAPASSALWVTAVGTDENAFTITGPGAGWTSLPQVSATDSVDHAADITLSAAWKVTTGSVTTAWGSSSALDWGGIVAGVLVSGTAPVQSNPNWPAVITEIAPGAGAQTLPAALSWTPLSARTLTLAAQQGRQYTLAQLQAGQGTAVVDNPDGALIPPGTGSFAGIDSGTPIRQRVIIPSLASPHYVSFSGYLQRWPFATPGDMLRGETQATIVDVWAYAAGLLNSMAREEMLLDEPYAVWPLDDPAGSGQGSNIAPGNSSPLNVVTSKYGAGGATVAFGANSGALIGDSSAKVTASGKSGGGQGMFSQILAGTSLNTGVYGSALVCFDAGYPPISAGVTIETWFNCQVNQATGGVLGFAANSSGSLFGSANGFGDGTPVVLSVAPGFTLPGGFSAGTVYYVVNVSGGNYQLSATLGGSAITVTSSGSGFIQACTPWPQVVFSARNAHGLIVEIDVRTTDGALIMQYRTAAGASHTVVVDSAKDYRQPGMTFVSAAFSQAAYRVSTGPVTVTGSFAAALPAAFAELCFGGVQDRSVQGGGLSGFLSLAAVYPAFLAPVRSLSHNGAATGLAEEAACDRVERILEYAGLTGRRWIGQQVVQYEGDLVVSGQDIGGQGAATSVSNIAASTVPAMAYVARTGDIVYWSKLYAWNQPVKWVLGDQAGLTGIVLDETGAPVLDESGSPVLDESSTPGEIPFLLQQFSTDYDPARVVNDIQLTQLDTQTVTVPSGVMAATTVAAIEAASEARYGDQPYQQTGYLNFDATSGYTAGGSMVDLAAWIANVYQRPRNRVQAVTVNAAANAANASSDLAWQFWAGASVGDMVQVNVRLPTAATSPLISLVARISQVSPAGQFSQDGTSATITCVLDFPPEYQALVCDDPVRGLLNGSNVLSW